jgi:hypothetical protein
MTNWQLIITLATLTLAIFGANGLSLYLANKRIDDLKSFLDARIESVKAELKGEIGELRVEVRAQGARIERIEKLIEPFVTLVAPGKGD